MSLVSMIIEELEFNRREWQDTVDSLSEVASGCLRAALSDWVSDSATRYREQMSEQAAEVQRLRDAAQEVVDRYIEHIEAVKASPAAQLPVF